MDSDIKAVYEKAMKELNEFFGMNWVEDKPEIIIVPDRKTIDSIQGKKTEDWVVGWVEGRKVYILSREDYEKESCHKYVEEDYNALIKHELTHCFSDILCNYNKRCAWLLEGISIYLSGQLEFKHKPREYKKFIDFYNKFGEDVYSESGFAVEYLIKEYGKGKLIELLKEYGKTKNKEEFAKVFKKIYGFELKYENFKVL